MEAGRAVCDPPLGRLCQCPPIPLDLLGQLLPAVSAFLSLSTFSDHERQARHVRKWHTIIPSASINYWGVEILITQLSHPSGGLALSHVFLTSSLGFPEGLSPYPPGAAGIRRIHYYLPSFPCCIFPLLTSVPAPPE